MTKLHLRKIKNGKAQELLEWFEFLNENPETIETLKEEQVNLEESFIFKIEGEWYCLYHMFSHTEILPSNKTNELNQQHKAKITSCLEKEDYTALLGIHKMLP